MSLKLFWYFIYSQENQYKLSCEIWIQVFLLPIIPQIEESETWDMWLSIKTLLNVQTKLIHEQFWKKILIIILDIFTRVCVRQQPQCAWHHFDLPGKYTVLYRTW